jgi:hypothetical protein
LAISHYEAILVARPNADRTRLGLGAALATIGNRERAIQELQKVAAGSDAQARGRAAEILKQMGALP